MIVKICKDAKKIAQGQKSRYNKHMANDKGNIKMIYSYALACENAMIEAMANGASFTIMGYIDGELHVPSLGLIL